MATCFLRGCQELERDGIWFNNLHDRLQDRPSKLSRKYIRP